MLRFPLCSTYLPPCSLGRVEEKFQAAKYSGEQFIINIRGFALDRFHCSACESKGAYTLRAGRSEAVESIAERRRVHMQAARLISRYRRFCAFLLLGDVKNNRKHWVHSNNSKKTIVNFIICSKSSEERNLEFLLFKNKTSHFR